MQHKSILVTGSTGQLGRSLQKIAPNYPEYSFTFAGRDTLDLSSSVSIAVFFVDKTFDFIINAAAYTAVDKAESEPELADLINHQAVKQIAQIAKKQNTMLIHISTDYVFNGQNYKPYTETDLIDPQNVYGLTKLKGEQAIQAIEPQAIIIRTSWVYSEFGNNFVKTMLRLGKERTSLNVIYDQVGTPTYAGDLAKAILDIIGCNHDYNGNVMDSKDKRVSVYHYSNEGVCSWFDFAKVIFGLDKITCQINPIETKNYPTPAKRPYYSLMNKMEIKDVFKLDIPYWKDSIQKMLMLDESKKCC